VITLVHDQYVGDLQNASLDGLDVIAETRRANNYRRISNISDFDL